MGDTSQLATRTPPTQKPLASVRQRSWRRQPCVVPADDVLTPPKSDSAVAEIDHRLREVRVALQVRGHAAGMRQPQDGLHFCSTDQVIRIYLRSHDLQSRNIDKPVLASSSSIGHPLHSFCTISLQMYYNWRKGRLHNIRFMDTARPFCFHCLQGKYGCGIVETQPSRGGAVW